LCLNLEYFFPGPVQSDIIEKKRWAVSLKQETSQWIDKDEFIRIIESKDLLWSEKPPVAENGNL